MISALLSLLLGSITGLAQYKIKRLLAYSTISHVGLILVSLGSNTINGLETTIFYILQYSITGLNTFLILILLGNTLNNNNIHLFIRLFNLLVNFGVNSLKILLLV